jgi:exodeoxyribonuclease-5
MNDRELILPNGKLITFNDQQYDGIKLLRNWQKSGNKFFTMAGFAGTGKTTIVKKILDESNRTIAVSAPTHKAKKVVARTTEQEALTLQAICGLRPDVELSDFNPNSPQFSVIAIPKISKYDILVIDEASMINADLFELIKTLSRKCSTQILFMGDPAQIPPIGEKESVVFSDPSIDIHWLTKIERQSDSNSLCQIYDALRNNLSRSDGGFNRITDINSDGEGVIFTKSKKLFRELLLNEFSSDEFKKDTDHVKLIAWRNDTVMYSNRLIRDSLFGVDADIVEVNDLLMGYRSISDATQQYNIIENSADYRIVTKSDLEQNALDIYGYYVKLRENTGFGKFSFKDIFIVDTSKRDNLHLYAEYHDFYRDMAKKSPKLWKKYYEFRRKNMILCNINEFRNGSARGSGDVIVKDLDYGFAVTGHKAQGSTYEKVFVLEDDIDANWIVKERNQIKYVALTRPSKSATVLSSRTIN